MTEQVCSVFNEERSFLLGLAARIVGSHAEAEDIVAEAFLRWQSVEPNTIDSPRAYLATIVTRLCINHLRSARVRREMRLGDFGLEELADPRENVEQLTDSLIEALNLVLQTLSPNERFVFILREVFQHSYVEIAALLKNNPENCRQLLKRARHRLSAQQRRFRSSSMAADVALHAFLSACRSGEIGPLLAILADDVALYRDAGDLSQPSPPRVHGKIAVGCLLLKDSPAQVGQQLSVQPLGPEAFLVASADQAGSKDTFVRMRGECVLSIAIVSCPERRRRLRSYAALIGAIRNSMGTAVPIPFAEC